jgi:hypothetical protein
LMILNACSSHAAHELYFASGAFQELRHGLPPVLTTPEQRELYPALAPSWDLLAEIGSPNLVHHLVQTLEMFVPVDPARSVSPDRQGGVGRQTLVLSL